MPEPATPVDEELRFAFCRYAIEGQKGFSFGVAMLLGFRGRLRVVEICSLQGNKVFIAADLASAVLELGLTKGGQRRGVEDRIGLEDPFFGASTLASDGE